MKVTPNGKFWVEFLMAMPLSFKYFWKIPLPYLCVLGSLTRGVKIPILLFLVIIIRQHWFFHHHRACLTLSSSSLKRKLFGHILVSSSDATNGSSSNFTKFLEIKFHFQSVKFLMAQWSCVASHLVELVSEKKRNKCLAIKSQMAWHFSLLDSIEIIFLFTSPR